LLQQLVQEQLL
jgi:hypothetical protein